jgi:hypothetical protein
MQTKKQSLIEQVVNIGIGFMIAQVMVLYLIPCWDTTTLTWIDSMFISSIFTSVSLCRGYIFRRIFNKLHSQERKDSA